MSEGGFPPKGRGRAGRGADLYRALLSSQGAARQPQTALPIPGAAKDTVDKTPKQSGLTLPGTQVSPQLVPGLSAQQSPPISAQQSPRDTQDGSEKAETSPKRVEPQSALPTPPTTTTTPEKPQATSETMAKALSMLRGRGRGIAMGRGRATLQPQVKQDVGAVSQVKEDVSVRPKYSSPEGITQEMSVRPKTSPSSSQVEVRVEGSPTPPTSGAAGVALAKMMLGRARLSPSATPTPGTTEVVGSEISSSKLSIARGRSELIHAHQTGSTTQPGAKPLKDDSQELSDKSSSITESLQHLSTEEKDKVVINQGTSGTKFSAMTNYIRLRLEEDKAVFEYEVKFHPEIDVLNLRYRLLAQCMEKLGSVKSFDGVILWLPIKIQKEISIFEATNPLTQDKVTVKVIYKKRTEMSKSIQLYNVLFNRIMKILKLARVGRNYYAPGEAVLVPQHKLEIWPGYVTAVSHQEGGLMLVGDVSHRILRTETCYETLSDLCHKHRGNFKQMAVQALIGCIVLTRYNNRTYRIDDILFDQNASSTFTNHKGEEMSYVDYYKNTYGITIQDARQPLLLHRAKKKDQKESERKLLCLVPELCYMTGLTDTMRADFRVMKDVAFHTRITPTVRQGALRKFISNVNSNPEARKVLEDWGLHLEDNVVGVEGRVLAPETIRFGNREVPGSENADWGRESCREKVIVPVDLKPRAWLILFSARDQPRAQKFSEMMRQVTGAMGIRVGDAQMVRLPDDRTETYVQNLKQYYNNQIQLAVIIFPTQRDDRYSAIKRIACTDLALPTQCINSRTISQENKLRSVTQKIALQINCKLGGELWALKIPINGLMVCGIDVYHDPAKRGNSVVGFVASTNQTLTRWYSRVTFQHKADEVVHGLKVSLLEALRNYHTLHHAMPRSIMVFRDGVGDGQLQLVEDHEVAQLASIFQHFDNYRPKLSLIVVQKRINTRIFASLSGRGLDNPPPGAVVDNTVTRRHWYDFLLVSQHVRQGTVSPTHYIVVKDGGNLKADNMQRLTYKLTHLYYNWPGTVRVPAPCLYAHKLAYQVGQNIRKEPASSLCDRLFFL